MADKVRSVAQVPVEFIDPLPVYQASNLKLSPPWKLLTQLEHGALKGEQMLPYNPRPGSAKGCGIKVSLVSSMADQHAPGVLMAFRIVANLDVATLVLVPCGVSLAIRTRPVHICEAMKGGDARLGVCVVKELRRST